MTPPKVTWIAFNHADKPPSLLRLSVVVNPEQADEVVGFDLKHSCVIVSTDVSDQIETGSPLSARILTAANSIASEIKCNFAVGLLLKTVNSIDVFPCHTPEELEEQIVSATVKIMKKAKENAAAAAEGSEVETPNEEVAESPDVPEPPKKTAKKPPAKKAATKKEPEAETVTEEKPTKSKTKAKTEAPTDKIAMTSSEIENLSETDAVQGVKDLIENQAFDEFKMGGYLAKIQTEGWFGEHPNFRVFVDAELGIKYRTAMYMIGLYNDLVESGVPWEKVKHLGWTKLKDLASILTTDNVDDILQQVEGMNAITVKAFVDDFLNTGGTSASSPTETTDIKSRTFKLFKEQRETVDLAIEKAKKESGTDSDAVALEHICTDFMAGSKKAKAKNDKAPEDVDLAALFKAIGDKMGTEGALNHVLTGVSEVFPKANIEVELEE